jgi:hypothetical protein
MDLAKQSSAELASLGASLYSAIDESQQKLNDINDELLKRGAAEFQTSDGKVLVIFPGPTIKPGKDAIARAKEICGILFSKLFDRVVVTKPRKDFRSLAAAVLTPAKRDKLIALCEVESTPYVRYLS